MPGADTRGKQPERRGRVRIARIRTPSQAGHPKASSPQPRRLRRTGRLLQNPRILRRRSPVRKSPECTTLSRFAAGPPRGQARRHLVGIRQRKVFRKSPRIRKRIERKTILLAEDFLSSNADQFPRHRDLMDGILGQRHPDRIRDPVASRLPIPIALLIRPAYLPSLGYTPDGSDSLKKNVGLKCGPKMRKFGAPARGSIIPHSWSLATSNLYAWITSPSDSMISSRRRGRGSRVRGRAQRLQRSQPYRAACRRSGS